LAKAKKAVTASKKQQTDGASKAARTCILVLGMHRSGTSMLTRVMNIAGAALPSSLMEANFANEAGYWESNHLMRYNDRLLEKMGSSWQDWRSIPKSILSAKEQNEAKQDIVNVIADEYGEADIFVVKDPRICRFPTLFINALEENNTNVQVVLAFRNPLAVCESLEKRNQISRFDAALLWLRHILDAEFETRGRPRVFLNQADLLDNWREPIAKLTTELDIRWPYAIKDIAPDIDGFINPELTHHSRTTEDVLHDPVLRGWVSDAWQALLVLSRNQQSAAALRKLDEVRNSFTVATPVLYAQFQAIAASHSLTEQSASQITAKEAQIGELEAQVKSLSSKLIGAKSALTKQKNKSENLAEQLVQTEGEAGQLSATLAQRSAEFAEQKLVLVQFKQELTEQKQSLLQSERQIDHLTSERQQLEATTDAKVSSLAQRIDEKVTQLRAKENALKKITRQFTDKLTELQQVSAKFSDAEQRNIALQHSTSWRLTLPLRMLVRALTRPKDGLLDDTSAIGTSAKPLLRFSTINPTPPTDQYVARIDAAPVTDMAVNFIAFYLPQYHTIEQNNEWWGEGFTEWSNVAPARPQFTGHYQPHVPDDLGYYDLTDPDVQREQVELAKLYGIGGFCFYFYWFNGKTLLEAPVKNYLDNPDIDFPFCICWANENWTRTWDGMEQNVLIAQEHSPDDDIHFISYVAKYLKDKRAIRVGGKPLLLVYRPQLLPDVRATVARWRQWCRDNGVGEIHLAYTQSFEKTDPTQYGFDAAIEFPPNNSDIPTYDGDTLETAKDFTGSILDWSPLYQRSENYQTPKYPLYRGLCPAWDNTARRGETSTILVNETPELFEKWAKNAIADTHKRFNTPSERLVFVNAWNEWAEGCHLEPDQKYGYAWLQAIRNAHECSSGGSSLAKPAKRIIVTSHDAHPHGAQYLSMNMARVLHDRFGYEVDLVVLGEGPLLPEFEKLARVHHLAGIDPRGKQAQRLVAQLVNDGAMAAICNTTVSGLFAQTLKEAGLQMVCLIHELPNVIEQYGLQEHTKAIAKHAKHVVFPARMVAGGFQKFTPVQSSKQRILPQGMYKKNQFRSQQDFQRAGVELKQHLGIATDAKIVLGVGYADERKGFDLFVTAAEQVTNVRSDVVFVWIGHHEAELAKQLSSSTDTLSEQGKLILPGLIGDTDPYYAGSDVYLLTSREDPYPSTVLEALDVGVPVIGFEQVTGSTRLISQLGGMLVPPFEIEPLVGALQTMLDKENLDTRWGRSCAFRMRPDVSFQGYVHDLLTMLDAPPKQVSVVVPNFNYAHFLPDRINSILAQTHPIRELIILDDASTDESLHVIAKLTASLDIPVQIIANNQNSGSVFKQWQKGVEAATCDYVWIAEADDLAEPGFLEEVMKGFDDKEVVLSYSQSKQMAEDGAILCDHYLGYVSDVSSTQWQQSYTRNGEDEIINGLSVKNTIPNVSAVVFNTATLRKTLTENIGEVTKFRVAGDWFVYVTQLRQGKIRFTNKSLNLHRRHDQSVTISKFGQEDLDEIRKMQGFVAKEFFLSEDWKTKAGAYVQELKLQFSIEE